jgi:hypothetical protein
MVRSWLGRLRVLLGGHVLRFSKRKDLQGFAGALRQVVLKRRAREEHDRSDASAFRSSLSTISGTCCLD